MAKQVKKSHEFDERLTMDANAIILIPDGTTGKLYKAKPGVAQLVLPVTKNTDFSVQLKAGQVLEYICLKNAAVINLVVSTTPGGGEILVQAIPDPQPVSLMRYAVADETIYFEGIPNNTLTKIKIV